MSSLFYPEWCTEGVPRHENRVPLPDLDTAVKTGNVEDMTALIATAARGGVRERAVPHPNWQAHQQCGWF